MQIANIIKSTNHRPWAIPNGSWKYYQEWNHAIFLHWQVDLKHLKPFIPDGLEIDLLHGTPWVSLVAFTMQKIRPRHFPAFPPISDFHEINIRTYVKRGGKSGVYFLSIEGGKRASCIIARRISELPYRYSRIKRQKGSYMARNQNFNDSLAIQFHLPGRAQSKSQLEHWLTERYALFQDADEKLNAYDIHHLAWPTEDIELTALEINYSRFDKLLSNRPDLQQYSEGVQVLAWEKEKIST